jgi:hypothetical protein
MEVTVVTGRWTKRGLCVTGLVRSVLSVCPCLGSLIGHGGVSGHDRPDAFGHCGSLLDSNRTLALWRPVRLASRPVAVSLERCSGWTSASGQLWDQCIRSSFARPVRATSASGQRDCSCFECLTALFEGVRL